MSDDLRIRLNAPAYAKLRELMRYYGETEPEAMISRALGLLQTLEPYVGSDGVLTVRNPHHETNGESPEVDLVFENRARQQAA